MEKQLHNSIETAIRQQKLITYIKKEAGYKQAKIGNPTRNFKTTKIILKKSISFDLEHVMRYLS